MKIQSLSTHPNPNGNNNFCPQNIFLGFQVKQYGNILFIILKRRGLLFKRSKSCLFTWFAYCLQLLISQNIGVCRNYFSLADTVKILKGINFFFAAVWSHFIYLFTFRLFLSLLKLPSVLSYFGGYCNAILLWTSKNALWTRNTCLLKLILHSHFRVIYSPDYPFNRQENNIKSFVENMGFYHARLSAKEVAAQETPTCIFIFFLRADCE